MIAARPKLAAIQFRPEKGAWETSAARLQALVERAIAAGASLVVCPEMALTGYLFPDADAVRPVAEEARGRTFERFRALCRAGGCYLAIGYPEAEGERLYNSALLIGSDGELRCNYRKRLLYELDMGWALPGDRPYSLVTTPFGTLTVGICMDLNDDRFIRFLHRSRPAIVAFCTNWLHQGLDMLPYWRHRLAGAPCHFVAADTYGREPAGSGPGTRFLGRSAVLDPRGRVLALAGEEGDAVLVAELPRGI